MRLGCRLQQIATALLLSVAILLSTAGSSGAQKKSIAALPSEAGKVMRSSIDKMCSGSQECEDIRMTSAAQVPLNTAERRNGIQDRWCAEYTLSIRVKYDDGRRSPWGERSDIIEATKTETGWSGKFSSGYCPPRHY